MDCSQASGGRGPSPLLRFISYPFEHIGSVLGIQLFLPALREATQVFTTDLWPRRSQGQSSSLPLPPGETLVSSVFLQGPVCETSGRVSSRTLDKGARRVPVPLYPSRSFLPCLAVSRHLTCTALLSHDDGEGAIMYHANGDWVTAVKRLPWMRSSRARSSIHTYMCL